MTNLFVLEIGTENLPASYIAPAADQLGQAMTALLDGTRLAHGKIEAEGTPRRLVVTVWDLADRQSASEEVVTGPPASRAWDDEGRLTPAAEGFARSRGIPPRKLQRIETPKGEFAGVRRRLKQRGTVAILREELPGVIAGLRFPKAMKWEESGARFARPIRWLLAMYGPKPVRFRFAGVASGNRTWRRPWMKAESAVVRSAGTYHTALGKLGVVVKAEKRRARIARLAETTAARSNLRVVDDPELVEELCYMVEDPRALMGSFPEEYLSLPGEVVTTAMRAHQRYIALTTRRGRLAPKFITFTDGAVAGSAEVRRGNERVLRARLDDAMFYWREDLKRGIDGLADELNRIVFIEGLGTIGEKGRRVERVAQSLGDGMRAAEVPDQETIGRAAHLAKADLASEMIKDGKEFTKLQGVIGSYYAQESGEDAEVVAAIREHYQPRTPGSPLPQGVLGAVIGIADRMDSICGCFIAGFKPTGSQDPYGLRRSANGLIRIVDAHGGPPLDEIIAAAFEAYRESSTSTDSEGQKTEVVDFMKMRAESYLRDNGVPYDVANAVVPVSWTLPGEALRRGREIARLRGDAVFERLITGVKRVGNILDRSHRTLDQPWESIRRALEGGALRDGIAYQRDVFVDPAERSLDAAVREAVPALEWAEKEGRFRDVLETLSGLADPIDAYFDTVLVNCEDVALRENRHRFLAVVYAVFGRYADFSRIVEEGESRDA